MNEKTERPDRMRILVLRAVIAVALILGLLLFLRLSGVTSLEQDVPIQMVENVVAASAGHVMIR